MFKKIIQSSAIVLALTFLAVPVKQASAQAPAPVVTGGNPMPTGESAAMAMILLGEMSTV